VDDAIQNCAIDTRRALYGNITLSGGSTMFRNFDARLQRDVKRILDGRSADGASNVDVRVLSHAHQRYAVWYGGSMLGASEGFRKLAFSKEDYEEQGPRIMRNSPVYSEF
jgi:actin-related protein 3